MKKKKKWKKYFSLVQSNQFLSIELGILIYYKKRKKKKIKKPLSCIIFIGNPIAQLIWMTKMKNGRIHFERTKEKNIAVNCEG